MATPDGSVEMRPRGRRRRIGNGTIAIILVIVLAAAGVGAYVALNPGVPREDVRVDGSSTVYPITAAWAEEFNGPGRHVAVAFSGTGGGFGKWCRGETDLSDASRPIRRADTDPATTTEEELCTQNGISGLVEFLVAYDGLSILVDLQNTFVQNLTVKELCRIWTSNTSAQACGGAGGHVTYWDDLTSAVARHGNNPAWPHNEIVLAGPGTDSGTYDYFVEVILTPFKTPIVEDFFKSENDNTLVNFVANEPNSLGFFGYAYVVENTDKIRPLAIDDEKASNGVGPFLPSEQSIKNGSYAPLSRPLFIYGHTQAPANYEQSLDRAVVRDFMRFGFSAAGQAAVARTGYVTLTVEEVATQVAKVPT